MSEHNELTRPLIDALNQTGGMALRMNSGKVKVARGFVQLHEEGTWDILFFPRALCWSGRGSLKPAQPIWIETKQPKGHTNKAQVDAQAAFKDKVEALGHRYIVVHSLGDIDKILG